MVEIGAAAKLEIAAVHLPCLSANAVRIRSRISAAARSVNVTATMRPGSMPRSKSSRYTSTSLRVFPVPALAHTTVLVSNGILTQDPPSPLNRRTSCTTVDIRNLCSPAFRLDQDAVCPHELCGSELPLSSVHRR